MDSKGNIRSGNKAEAKPPSSAKAEKANPGPTPNADKKETPKEQPAPAITTSSSTKKAGGGGDPSITNNHSNLKGNPGSTEPQEAPRQSPDSEHKEKSSEECPGSIFDNMKPLLVVGGVAVAALAVMLGVAFLARKK